MSSRVNYERHPVVQALNPKSIKSIGSSIGGVADKTQKVTPRPDSVTQWLFEQTTVEKLQSLGLNNQQIDAVKTFVERLSSENQ